MKPDQPEATAILRGEGRERTAPVSLHVIPQTPEEQFDGWVRFLMRLGNCKRASEDKARRLMTGEEIVMIPGAAKTFADLPALPQRTGSGPRTFDPGWPFPWTG